MYIINVRFAWDKEKARRNAVKHGVGFKEATTAFHDRDGMLADDLAHSRREPRYWLIGESVQGRLLVVIFTKRPGGTTRLISARLALAEERRDYEENRDIPL